MRRKRLIALAVAAVLLLVVGVAGWRVPALASVGTGYAAQQTCACVFVSRRTPESCQGDLLPLARKIVSTEVGEGQVSATSFGHFRAVSRHEEGFGCALQP